LASKLTDPPGHARETWTIFRALSEECGVTLPYDSLEELRSRLFNISPHLQLFGGVAESVFGKIATMSGSPVTDSQIHNTPLESSIDNYYMTDAISRASVVMAKCSTSFNPTRFNNFKKIGN